MSESHSRGVFRQTYNGPGGTEIFSVVSRRGECLARVVVPDRAKRGDVTRQLEGLLELLDPPPIELHG